MRQNIKKILADPVQRREMLVRATHFVILAEINEDGHHPESLLECTCFKNYDKIQSEKNNG